MSDLSNNVAILSYLKDKIHKWKNISIILMVISFILVVRMIFGDDLSHKIETGSYIANIKIDGTIFEDDFRSKALNKIAEDNSAKAVILTIDSPGGGIVGSEMLYLELKDIAQKKPLVVLMGSAAASGAYMASIASEHIIAHNGTLTGSIGVLMQSAELVDLASKLGVKFKTYKSAPLKASPSPFEKSSDNVNKVVQESIEDSANFFFDLVKERRGEKLKKDFYAKIFDGRVFTGRQALAAGLVDEIGSKQQALEYLKNKHKIDSSVINLRDIDVKQQSGSDIIEKIFGKISILDKGKMLSGTEIMAIANF